MKNAFLRIACLVFLAFSGLDSCKAPQDPAALNQATTPTGTTPSLTGRPQILEMSIAQLPNSEGVIDEQKKEITFTFPDSLQSFRLDFSYKLSPGAGKVVMLQELPDGFMGIDERTSLSLNELFFNCPKGEGCSRVGVGWGTNFTTEYKLIFKPAGPLQIKLPYRALFQRNEVPVVMINPKNVVGNSFISELSIHSEEGKEVHRQSVAYSQALYQQNEYTKPLNQFPVVISKSLPNGKYTVKFRLRDGTTITADDPLRIEGPMDRLFNACTGGSLPADLGRIAWPIEASQFKLNTDDKVEFAVTSRTGVVQKFKGLETIPDGGGWLLVCSEPIQGQLKPGNYTVSVFVNGQARNRCYSLSILRYPEQPFIGGVVTCNMPDNCNDRAVVELKQGQRVVLGLPYYIAGWEKEQPKHFSATLTRVKLVDVVDPNHIEYAPVSLPRVVETHPFMALPADIKPGRYQLTFQIGYGDEVFESEPFIRDIEIR